MEEEEEEEEGEEYDFMSGRRRSERDLFEDDGEPEAGHETEMEAPVSRSPAKGASEERKANGRARFRRRRRKITDRHWLRQADAERRRNWVSVSKDGSVSTLAMSKYDVSYYAGIPFRDLLILDPVRPVPYYAAIFLRPPGAIVVSLEHMRLVICNEKALILNAEEPRVAHFIADLSARLRKNAQAPFAHSFPSDPNRNSADENNNNTTASAAPQSTATPEDVTAFVRHGTRRPSTNGIAGDPLRDTPHTQQQQQQQQQQQNGKHKRHDRTTPQQKKDQQRSVEYGSELTAFLTHFQEYSEDPHRAPPHYPASPTGLENLPSQAQAMLASPYSKPSASFANLAQADAGVNPMLDLPFELRVLECVLTEVCERLDFETRALDEELTPALETLARRVRFSSLQRVRRMKSRMNRLMTRVDDVRDELRKVLGDDGDMRDMCLTTKSVLVMHQQQQDQEQQMSRGNNSDNESDDEAEATERNNQRSGEHEHFQQQQQQQQQRRENEDNEQHHQQRQRIRLERCEEDMQLPHRAQGMQNHSGNAHSRDHYHPLCRKDQNGNTTSRHQVYSGAGAGSGTSFTSSSSKDTEKALKKDLEEERESVEALLEAFFIHSEQSKKRLAIMREAVNDTENMNELNLDQIRNELFKMEVTLTNATLAAGFFAAVVGAFGMNLRNGMENSRPAFLTVVGLTGLVMLAMSFGIQYTIYRQIQ
jgi:hypothetical protein